MGLFKSLVDKMKGAREDLEKKAAKKAAEVALEQAKKTAKGALDSAGDAIERAIFGEVEKEEPEKKEPPDPFAHLKAREEDKKAREKAERDRKKREEKIDREVDDELAAMKKKLGKK